MNKNNRKKKGLSKRVLALMLCCFCLLATVPISAFALGNEGAQITEESISEQQSVSSGDSILSLSSEKSESQTEMATQQKTSDEIIEPITENGADTEVETEGNSEIGTESGTETGTATETGSETGDGAGGETDEEAGDETSEEAGAEIEKSPVDALFEHLMSATTYEELNAMMEAMTEEEHALLTQFTEEQNYALSVKVNELGGYGAATLETVDVNPDANFIMVGKTFQGITGIQVPGNFAITVAQATGKSYHLTKETATISEDGLSWKWRIDNVGAGTYTVSESNATVENHDLTTSGLGTVEVKAADFQVTYVKETTCSHQNWPVAIDGDQNVLFAAALTGGGCVVISKDPLTATQRATVAASITGIGGNWKDPVEFYSISTNGNGPWSINGKSLEYKPGTQEIWLSKTSDWTHVATVKYSISEASNPDIEVINTYTPNTRNLTVNKTVSGNMYDADKEFAFTVTYGNETATFNLKKDETYTIEGIPVGTAVTVSENPDDYTYSFVSITDGVTKEDTTNGVSFTMPAQDVTVVINNDKTVTVDTGVLLDTLPYILILGIVAVGAVLLIKKRRNRDDD